LAPLFSFVSDKPAALRLAVGGPPDADETPPAPESLPSPPSTPIPREIGGFGLLRGSRRRKLS
ncbi:MAG: anti-sigma factor antagonist, partial [Singulisphaera sp.]